MYIKRKEKKEKKRKKKKKESSKLQHFFHVIFLFVPSISLAQADKEPYKINSGAKSEAKLPAVYRAHHNARILCVMEHPTLKTRLNSSLLLDVQCKYLKRMFQQLFIWLFLFGCFVTIFRLSACNIDSVQHLMNSICIYIDIVFFLVCAFVEVRTDSFNSILI